MRQSLKFYSKYLKILLRLGKQTLILSEMSCAQLKYLPGFKKNVMNFGKGLAS